MENQTNNPAGTKPEAARDGLAEAIQKIEAARVRLYALADDALDDCQAGEEVESVARLLSYAQEAIEKAKGDAPALSSVPVDALAAEIYRRHKAGECVALVITPNDLAEHWECDESGATHPGSRVPEAAEMRAICRSFERWMDRGACCDLMETMRDAWLAEATDHPGAQEGEAK